MAEQTTFFFGAGAEARFGMPLGAQYTLDTILSKRSKMYEALKDFYKDKLYEECKPYSEHFLFTKTSHTFKEIVKRASEKLKSETNSETNIDKKSQAISALANYIENYQGNKKLQEYKSKKENFDYEIEKLHNYVILDIDKPTAEQRTQNLDDEKAKEDYLSLMRKFSYYGTVEKDFSTIINPKEAGVICFWRLINYFWSAFFSIIFPVLKLSSKYCGFAEENKNCKKYYKYILDNLNEIIKYIYSEEYFKKNIAKKYSNCYYCKLSKAFPNSNAVTTNYTPFLKFYYQSPIYLAGKLSQFEIPNELRVVDLNNGDTYAEIADKMIFPFMLTQAPIKPIIDTLQLNEYSNFMRVLNETKTLVIVGYGINENDNHINALIRDFLVKNTDNRLVFVKHIEQNVIQKENMIENEKGEAAKKLKISDPAIKQKITVIPNYGTPEDIDNLIVKLKEITL